MSNRDSILSKLEALMKRTRDNGASEAEVEAAMKIARRLMDEHNIAMEEVLTKQASAGPATIEIKEEEARTASKMDRFEQYLMSTAADVCDVRWYYQKSHKWDEATQKRKTQVKLVFFGMAQDVLAARFLFLELLVVVRSMARAKVGTPWGQRHYYYCDGFCSGLANQANKLKKQSQDEATSGTGLILLKDNALVEYETNVLKAKPGKHKAIAKSRLHSTEFQTGWSDGYQYELNPKRETPIAHNVRGLPND